MRARRPRSQSSRPLKITGVKAVYPKWRVRPGGPWQSYFWQIVVEVRTDTGGVGYGYGGGGSPAVEIVNSHFRDLLMGRDVNSIDDIRDIWDLLFFKSLPYGRKGIPVMALSGVDLALWDLLAKFGGPAGLRAARRPQEGERQGVRYDSRYRARPRCRIHLGEALAALEQANDSDYDDAVEMMGEGQGGVRP